MSTGKTIKRYRADASTGGADSLAEARQPGADAKLKRPVNR
jgi:hypothetical protein